MLQRLKAYARIRFFIAGMVAVSLLAACAFVSKGTVVVSSNCPGCEPALTDDAVTMALKEPGSN